MNKQSFCFQEGKLKDTCMIGQSDVAVEDKTVTIAYGTDMTSISFVNFVCSSRETAKVTEHNCLIVGN
jgi:hypothetical protein